MKLVIRIFTLSYLAGILASCSSPAVKTEATKGSPAYVTKSNGQVQLQPYKEQQLSNGLKIVFIRDSALPRVSLTMLVKVGSINESAKKAGLNSLTAMMLEQGTQSNSATKIADEFGQLGSSLDISPGYDFTTLYSDSLITSADTLLNLFSDVVLNPAFKEAEIARIRSQIIAGLRKKVDNPSSFADSKMDEFLYQSHPYGRDLYGSEGTLKSLQKQDVIKHFLTYFRPNNATLAVVGSFDESFEKKVETAFAKWTRRSIPAAKVEAAPEIDSLKLKLFVKKGLQQTQVRISGLGIARTNEDFLRLRLANEALGGSFASRLNQKIRSELGLTYSIYSGFDVKKDRGSFDVSTFTKNETAEKMLDETLKVISEYANKGANENEAMASRAQLIGQFPRAIETADRLAFNILVLDFYGIPVDYLVDYNRSIEAIKLKEANGAFAKAINAEKLKVVIYGNESIVGQFEKYKPEVEYLK